MQFPILKNIWDLSFTIIRQQKRAEVASAISLFFSNVLKKIYISEKTVIIRCNSSRSMAQLKFPFLRFQSDHPDEVLPAYGTLLRHLV